MEYLGPYNCPCSFPYVVTPEWFVTQHYANLFNKSQSIKDNTEKEDSSIMKVTYNDYTGELWEFKRLPGRMNGKVLCNITILCQDCAKVSFESVRLEDLRFSGANVSFGG